MRRRAARLALTLLLTAAANCGGTSPDPMPDRDLRILFVGNSLTYANDLPSLVQQLGRGDPSRPVIVSSVAYGNYSLEDHWNRGEALAAIQHDPWDLVVLQQGPSALPASRTNLLEWVTRFATEIRRAGARPAVYMVWPPLARADEWDAVTESYTAAAGAADALLFPAGEALRSARAADPALPLFGGDGFHPAPIGSWCAALVIYAVAANTSPLGLTASSGGAPYPPGQIAVLEAAAADAIQRLGTRSGAILLPPKPDGGSM
jgi:hypothetical protein